MLCLPKLGLTLLGVAGFGFCAAPPSQTGPSFNFGSRLSYVTIGAWK
jgi:hypothetical protein